MLLCCRIKTEEKNVYFHISVSFIHIHSIEAKFCSQGHTKKREQDVALGFITKGEPISNISKEVDVFTTFIFWEAALCTLGELGSKTANFFLAGKKERVEGAALSFHIRRVRTWNDPCCTSPQPASHEKSLSIPSPFQNSYLSFIFSVFPEPNFPPTT